MHTYLKSFAAIALILTVLIATTSSAVASTTPDSGLTGFDISFPQCGGSLPASAGFGIVGVNNGSVFTTNKCLATELTWATEATNGSPSFYANTANGGPTYGAGWPTSQQTPDVCSGGNSVACAYDYGWNAARSSFANAVAAETTDGATNATLAARSAPWWLDVETGNSWETIEYGRTAATEAYDTAMLEGEVAILHQHRSDNPWHLLDLIDVVRDYGRHDDGVLHDSCLGSRLCDARRGRSGLLCGLFHRRARRDDSIPLRRIRWRLCMRALEHAGVDGGLSRRLGDL